MIIDLIWTAGECLSIVALLSGAYLALMESEPFSYLFGRKSSAPLSLSPMDVRLIVRASQGAMGHSLSGNGAIDAQHERLADCAKELQAAILSGRAAGEVDLMIDTLIRAMAEHFQDEERILTAADYPEITRHATLHRDLLSITASMIGQFRDGSSSIGELCRFLNDDALARHTQDADRELIPYLEGRLTVHKAAA